MAAVFKLNVGIEMELFKDCRLMWCWVLRESGMALVPAAP
jgi:hypothetical protein